MRRSMTVVDATHWLVDGDLPFDQPGVYRNALRMAQCIEYGGPLPPGCAVLTLIPCRRRPGNQSCLGLLHVVKTEDDLLHAYCPTCHADEFLIRNWQATMWADGPPEPIPVEAMPMPTPDDLPPEVRALVTRALAPYPLSLDELVVIIAAASHPSDVMQAVSTRCVPNTREEFEELLSAIMIAWNVTPRPDLDGHSPTELWEPPAARPAAAPPRTGRNEPCPCGSGRKYKRCCLN